MVKDLSPWQDQILFEYSQILFIGCYKVAREAFMPQVFWSCFKKGQENKHSLKQGWNAWGRKISKTTLNNRDNENGTILFKVLHRVFDTALLLG